MTFGLLDLPIEIANIISRHILYKRPQFVLQKITIKDLNGKLLDYIKYVNKMSPCNYGNIMLETILSCEVLKNNTIGKLLRKNIHYTNAYYKILCKMFGPPIEVLCESKKLKIVNKYNKGDILLIKFPTRYKPCCRSRMIKIDRVTDKRYYYRLYSETSIKSASGESVLKYIDKGEMCENIIIFENKQHVLTRTDILLNIEHFKKFDKIKIVDRLNLVEIQDYQRLHDGNVPQSYYKEKYCVNDIFKIPNMILQ